jgi:hypothetical protein
MTPAHTKADKLMAVVEALKTAGYDLAVILSIVKGIQGTGYESLQELPDHFSIINNKYLSIPAPAPVDVPLLFDMNNTTGPAIEVPPEEQKLMALTFWL